MKTFFCVLSVLILTAFVSPSFAGDTAQLRATIKMMKKQGLDASALEQLLAEEEKSNSKKGYVSKDPKPNLFEKTNYAWMTDCSGIDDVQFYTMCANANLQYVNYIKMMGTANEAKAYKVHEAAVDLAISFYEKTK
jgi:L-asparaginase II